VAHKVGIAQNLVRHASVVTSDRMTAERGETCGAESMQNKNYRLSKQFFVAVSAHTLFSDGRVKLARRKMLGKRCGGSYLKKAIA